MSRFSQAISEGDGISVIPLLDRDAASLAASAAGAGAEALAVRSGDDVERVRPHIALPVLVLAPSAREEELERLQRAGADACVITARGADEAGGRFEEMYAFALEIGLECVVEVRDEEELENVLEQVDPDILLISERTVSEDSDEFERTLDLLPDVPAGKLVISEAAVVAREQVLALERAGVDAIVVPNLSRSADFPLALEELVRGPGSTS